ncbi:hypothetical protein AB205_0099280 [Aquarana catesbeiana]|uniref:MADF domain-containing protein n=1 Tax=Aquarana catesbeiana TaxID=8400 RepID=A0A2G9QEQ7_AQUCT|nr:hypothetical protein AB205_0099280 [Aquarana catesbeiana]
MDMLLKDNDFMSLFIDMLRELPCLWEINHPHYKNQTKRKAALDQLLEIVKQVIPTADITYFKILIGGLRSTYVRERQKVQDSLRSGAADDIYVPRMWYYDRLHFLAGQTEPRPSLSSLPSTLPSPPAEASDAQPGPSRQQHMEEPRLSQGSLSQEVAGPSRLADLQVPPPPPERESGSRRSALEEVGRGLFWKATEVLGAQHTMEEDIAATIAFQMQRMEEGQQVMCPPPSPPSPPYPPPSPPPPPDTSPTAQPQPRRKCGRKTRKRGPWVQSGRPKDAASCGSTAWGHRCHLLLSGSLRILDQTALPYIWTPHSTNFDIQDLMSAVGVPGFANFSC